jgi:hypothetical protein
VIYPEGRRRYPCGQTVNLWRCRCVCGSETIVTQSNLTGLSVRSCGCLRGMAQRKHSYALRGNVHPIYRCWQEMKRRCSNPKRRAYKNYGGRGIGYCKRWENFDAFLKDMGPSWKLALTLERKDNDAGYAKSNCRWIPKAEQPWNTRRNIQVRYRSQTKPLFQWVRELNLSYALVRARIRYYGWSPADAFTRPNRLCHQKHQNIAT